MFKELTEELLDLTIETKGFGYAVLAKLEGSGGACSACSCCACCCCCCN